MRKPKFKIGQTVYVLGGYKQEHVGKVKKIEISQSITKTSGRKEKTISTIRYVIRINNNTYYFDQPRLFLTSHDRYQYVRNKEKSNVKSAITRTEKKLKKYKEELAQLQEKLSLLKNKKDE